MSLKAGTSIATALDLGVLTTNIQTLDDAISAVSTAGYYRFTIAENSKLNIKLSGLSQNADLFLLNADGSQVTAQSALGGNVDENIIQNLRAGSYFFHVRGGGAGTNYRLETSAISLGPIPVDSAGSSPDRANDLGILGATATVVNEFIGNFNGLETDFADYHQFTITENSTVNLKLTGLSQNAALTLQDSQGNLITGSDNSSADKNIAQNLRAGIYSVFISNSGGNGTSYRFEANAVSLGAVPVDNAGESPYKAKNLGTLGTTEIVTNDFLGNFNGLSTDGLDYYQFTIAENSTVNLKLSGLSQDVTLQLYDSQQNLVQTSAIGGNADENITRNLRAGTYYLYATGGGNGTNYRLTASAASFGAVPSDTVGDALDKAKNVGVLSNVATVVDEYVGGFGNFGGSIDFSDYYQFTITANSTVNLTLSGLSQDTNISLLDSQGGSIKTSAISGTSDENISQKLRSGTYFVLVSAASGLTGSNYRFSASAEGLGSTPVDSSPLNQASDLGTITVVTPALDGEIAADNFEKYYKFTVSENSTVSLKLSGLNQDANIALLSTQGSTIVSAATFGNVDEIISRNLRAGVYYLRAQRGAPGALFAPATSLTFRLDANATSLGAIPTDNPGGNIDQAQDLGILKAEAVSATDFLGNFNNLSSDFSDYYKFTLADNSTVNLKLSGLSQDANISLLNSNGNTILSSSNAANSDESISRNLLKGTYYARVDGGIGLSGGFSLPGGASEAKNTTYKLDASAIALGAIPVDNAGENIDQARDLGAIKTEVVSATDFLGNFRDLASDFSDYYKFTIADNSIVSLKLSGLSEDANFSLLNNRGTIILSSRNTGSSDENIGRNLQKGTYYVRVDGGIGLFGGLGVPGNSSSAKGTNYKLDVSAVSVGAPPADNAGESINTARDLGIISEPQQIADYVGNFNGLSNDFADYYKFRVTTDSFLNLNITEAAVNPNLQLFNSAGRLLAARSLGFNTPVNASISQGITAGTYFLGITSNGNTGSSYNLNIAAPTITDLAGSNNQTARDVGVLNGARVFTDFVGLIDPSDVYRFELKEKSTFNLNFNPDKVSDRTFISLTNAKGQGLTVINAGTNTLSRELDPGVYYARIDNYFNSDTDTNYSLNLSAIAKQNSAFQILSVNPIAGSNQGEATIDIKGTKFTPTARVSIVDPAGKEVTSSAVTVLNDTNIAAKFDLKGQVVGAYDLKVVDGADQAVVNDIYLVNDLAPGRLQVDIAAPGAVRPGAKGELVITYRNAGNTDIAAPLLTLVANGALLEESGEYRDGTIQFLGINKEGNAGVLPAGATGSVRVKFRAALDATNIDFQVNSLALDESVDWNSIKESSRPEGIAADVWDKIYSNFVISVGGKASEFQKVLDDNANRLSQLGEYTGDISRLLSFELQQVNSNAISARSTVGAFGRGGVNPWDVSAITDAAGNVAIQTGDRRRTFSKAANGTYTASTDDYGVLTKQGDIYQVREYGGTVQSFLANGKLDFVQDTNENKVTLGYTANLLTGLSYSNGDAVSFKYNALGRINEVVDIYGQSTTYTYDASGDRLLSVSDVSGVVSYAYETEGVKANAIKSITYPDGTQSLFEYDDLGRVTQESLNGGEQTLKYSYDSTGGVTVTDANNKSTQVLLNDRGQVAQTTDALGRVSRFSYDSKGNLTQVLAPDSSTAKFTYDSKDNLLASTDALGQSVQFAYDSRYDQIKSVSDQKGNAINYSYDDKGNLGSIGYADGSKESFTYSNEGDVTVSSNRRGQQISYTYDSRGLLTKKGFADGTAAAFEYDVRGNLTKATDADSSVSYGYDAADRLTNVSYGGTRSLSFSYDAGGRRNQMVDQDGFATNYSYDSVGRLKQLTDKDAKSIVIYNYNTLGQLSREDNGNGTYTAYTYDDAGQALSIVNYKPDNSINSRYDYTYNQLRRRTSMTTLEGNTSYGYDAAGQLTSVALASGRSIEYKYDAAGNRITVKDSGATTNYSTNNLNQYTTVGGDAYAYDKDGNLTSKTVGGKTSSFSYDIENRLIGVTNPDGTWQYQYDALGNRIGSTFNGQKTDYLLDPTGLGDVVGEYTGSQATRYSHGLGLASRNDGTNTSFFDTDAIGSVVGLSGTGGNYLNSYSYLPFGENLTKTETVTNSFEYVGQYGVMNEANGLDFMRARFYTPGEGRFINADPIGINGQDVNFYRYVGNNSTTFIDPLGLWSNESAQNGAAFGAAAGTVVGGIVGGINGVAAGAAAGFAAGLGVGSIPGAILGGATGAATGGAAGGLIGGTAGYFAGGYSEKFVDKKDTDNKGDDVTIEGDNNKVTVKGKGSKVTIKGKGNDITIDDEGGNNPPQDDSDEGNSPASSPKKQQKDFVGSSTRQKNKKLGDQLEKESPKGRQEANGHTTTARPLDPNDIIGPGGTGPDRWLTPDPILPYTIRFENQSTATAPAVLVNITHTLDSDLDLNTFELGDFGFGSTTITVPDGLQNYTTRLDLRDTIGDFVDFTATLDTTTRLVTWQLITIDPLTGEPAQGVTDGFLPPNNANRDGDGFVNYRIKAKNDTPNGASLDAQASIVFDTNAPIVTPVWTNKIDTAAPTSTITTLPATINTTDFTVTWTGSDSGSGVASYDIYVSDNSGAFQIWKTATADTSATYSGIVGHTYSFYSIATDGVGRTQANPSEPISTQLIAAITNQPPSQPVLNPSQVAENVLIGSTVGKLTTTDPDSGDTLTYSLTTGEGSTNNDLFEIVGDELKLKISPDYETKLNYSIRAKVADQAGLSSEQTFTISITDVNEPPTQLVINNSQLAENVPINTVVGTFNATTPNGDTLTYSLVTGEGGTDNQFFEIVNNTIRIKITPDFEIKPNYTVRVKATNQNGLSTEKPFPINITNTNETPTKVTIDTPQIAENSPINTVVAKLATTDPDANDSFTYSLAPNNLFTITGNELRLIASPDYEAKDSYQIQITSTDQAGLSINQPFTINIVNVTEPTTLINTNDRTFQITGDQGSKNITFQINSQNPTSFTETGLFKVDDNLGTINGIQPGDPRYLAAALDRFQIISSIIPIANRPQGFDGNTNRSLNLNYNDIVRFGVVNGSSIDQLRQTPADLNQLTFSEPTTLKLSATNGNLALNWQAPLNLNLSATINSSPSLTLGTATQSTTQGELIDLRQTTTDTTATFSIYREASHNNHVYFYALQNTTGTILDGTTTLNPTDSGYIQAALRSAITDINLSTANQSTSTYTSKLTKGTLFAPIIVVNGTKDALLDSNRSNDPAAYTSFILGNADKTDHIRLLGDNTFGFEDLANGGDLDYNDIIVKVNLQPIA